MSQWVAERLRAMTIRIALFAGMIGLVVTGCSAPVVTITHALPAALPVVEDGRAVNVGSFSAHGDATEEQTAFAAEALGERLMELGIGQLVPGDGRANVTIGGTVHVTVTNTEGERMVRVRSAQTGVLADQTVPSLVRTLGVACDFVAERGLDAPPVTIEVRRAYDSRNDPRVRGDLGLARNDDPATIPDADTVARELVADCVDSFVGMIRPHELTVTIPMRPVGGESAQAGLAAAGEGRFAEALDLLQAEAAGRPNDLDLRFNVAVAAEAAGQFDLAVENYRFVARQTDRQDELAVDGLDRAKKVRARIQYGP